MSQVRVVEAVPEQWPQVWSLLERSFAPAMLGPRPEAGEALGPSGRRLRVALGPDDDRLLGCAVLRAVGEDAVLLDYLAVDPDVRARGTGRALLADAVAQAHRAGADWLLLEVAPPHGAAHPAYGDPVRRLAFYRRAGAVPVASGYGVPDQETGGLLDMELLAVPTHPEVARAPGTAQVAGWVRRLWSTVYRRPAEDPALDEVLARLRPPEPQG